MDGPNAAVMLCLAARVFFSSKNLLIYWDNIYSEETTSRSAHNAFVDLSRLGKEYRI